MADLGAPLEPEPAAGTPPFGAAAAPAASAAAPPCTAAAPPPCAPPARRGRPRPPLRRGRRGGGGVSVRLPAGGPGPRGTEGGGPAGEPSATGAALPWSGPLMQGVETMALALSAQLTGLGKRLKEMPKEMEGSHELLGHPTG